MAEVTEDKARRAVARLGVIVDREDGSPASLEALFMACEAMNVAPPSALLAFIEDDMLRLFGYEV